jgi:hypothetical protein
MSLRILKQLTKALFVVIPAWLGVTNTAHATQYFYSSSMIPNQAVTGYVHKDPDYNEHWIAWFPRNRDKNCSYVAWQKIGEGTLPDHTVVVGSDYDDMITDVGSPGSICGYSTAPVSKGSFKLTLRGSGANDTLRGYYVDSLMGGDGDDRLTNSNYTTTYFYGDGGNDNLCGLYNGVAVERYEGGAGVDCMYDKDYIYIYQTGIETFGTCGC